MGVPKFFRHISERYPCIHELVNKYQIPEFDNFYLDMNGIIHACSHPPDFNPHFSITDKMIFDSIFHYIEVLFSMINPKKLFFLAVDGVAPRAKMNQQRARRFRSSKEVELKEKQAMKESDQPLPKNRFDSNAITPGTVFMEQLHTHLQYFINSKISTDPLWQNCKIILSGHRTPGEGEHKIMDYIRYLKTLPDYDDNTRHCLYGLDADLFMLGLCTHEPHFCLLREKVQFSRQKSKKISTPDTIDFYFFHLSILREYLDWEFHDLRESLPFQYNLENIIDDWVLMGFLIGNDFIPNLPDLHIQKNAFSVLYKTYKEVILTLDGYINENGYLNLPRFQKFMEKLADHDLTTFKDTYANLAFLEEKTGKREFPDKKPNGEVAKSSELEELIKATEDFLETSGEESVDEEADDNDTFLWEFSQHKKNYYAKKLEYSKVTEEVLKSQAEGYVRAIQWNLHYYYHGCQSWSWFYPHHYAPYISDIRDFQDLKIEFDMGKPFLPFEQLLAVLPAASKNLLPEVYQDLMTSPNSPIIDFYPDDFETDLNGKLHDWEAVVLIPFIEEKRLLEAMEPFNKKLTPEENQRNSFMPMHVFTYTSEELEPLMRLEGFPAVPRNHALKMDVFVSEIAVEKCDLKYGLRPGVRLDRLQQGFLTLKHLPHKGAVKVAKIKSCDMYSKGESLIITLTKREFPPPEDLAKLLSGKIIYVNWPFLVKARVVAVSDIGNRFYLTEEGEVKREALSEARQAEWLEEGESITRHYAEKCGVEIGPVDVLVHVLTVEGQKYVFGTAGKVSKEYFWSDTPTAYPLQVIVQDVQLQNDLVDFKELFPVNSVVFMLGQPHFGSMGHVLETIDCNKSGRVNVELETVNDPIIDRQFLETQRKTLYLPCKRAALRVGISPRLLARITGNILVSMTREADSDGQGYKINVGLSMKFFKKREEIPGYTKLENEVWLYSPKAITVVEEYVKKFSRVVEYLSNNQSTNVFYIEDIFPGTEGVTEMKEMVAWIKELEFKKLERVKCGSQILDSEMLAKIEELVEKTPKQSFKKQLQVKPHLLYKNDLVFGNLPPVSSAQHALLDRVVAVKDSSGIVPLGLRGFIVGIHTGSSAANTLYEIFFDKSPLDEMKSELSRTVKMTRALFLNVTDAKRQAKRAIHESTPSNTLRLNSSPEETKMSAFAQWTQSTARPPEPKKDDEFKKIWASLQTAKPQEDALKKILKIEKEEKKDIEDPVKLFFESVTKGAKKTENSFLTAIENVRPPTSYYLKLSSYYRERNLKQPKIKYMYLGGMVTAQIFDNQGKWFLGMPSHDKDAACESAAFQALNALKEIPFNSDALWEEKEREKKVRENQSRLTNALIRPKAVTQEPRIMRSNYRPNDRRPPLLPDPPLQWVGRNSEAQGSHTNPSKGSPRGRTNKETPEKPSLQNPRRNKLNASTLEFVPLQAIVGKRNFGKLMTIQTPKQTRETTKKAEVVPTITRNSEPPSSTTKPKRKPKIAAKLNLDPNLY